MNSFPEGIDTRLVVKLVSCTSDHYLSGNPHTFRGRIATWCPLDGVEVNICKSGIVSSTVEAGIWIDGFLAGNEPPPPDFDDIVSEERWEQARREFRLRGVLPEQ